jgi:hypothetical protein
MKDNNGRFTQNIVIIATVLAVVFLSQNASFRPITKQFYIKAEKQITPYWVKTDTWFKVNVYPRVASEVQKRGATATQQIATQKNNVVQNIWQGIKQYIANIFSKISGTQVK